MMAYVGALSQNHQATVDFISGVASVVAMSDINQIIQAAQQGQSRIVCPFCAHQRRGANQRMATLKVSDLGDRVVWHCHHCNEAGAAPTRERSYPMGAVAIKPKEPLIISEDRSHIEFLSRRGISEATADKFGVFTASRWIGSIGSEADCVGYPYTNQGVMYAAKFRAIEAKGFSCHGAPASFFGLEQAQADGDLFIVEGETDQLSMAEAGLNAVSVPNGAPMKVAAGGHIDPSEDGKFRFVWAAKKLLDSTKRVILAVDADAPGDALAEELARRIGKLKCYRLHWPQGIKDANEFLVQRGADALKEWANENVVPWPVAGLHAAAEYFNEVDELYRNGLPPGESTGWPGVDEFVTIQQGLVYIVTGTPGHGKSSWLDNVLVNMAERSGTKTAFASFENPTPLHIAKLSSIHARKPFKIGPTSRMTYEEMLEARNWIDEHFLFLGQDGVLPTVESIIERGAHAVMRYGVRNLVVDPFNFIQLDNENGTEAINKMLSQLKLFAQAHGCAVFLVAHPAKPGPMRKDDWVPTGYDISGSAHFFNRTDFGVTVTRTKDNVTRVVVWKCRFSHLGKIGESPLVYDIPTGRFEEGAPEPEETDWNEIEF